MARSASVPLSRHLSAIGYGTRRETEALIAAGVVTDAGGARLADDARWTHDAIRVHGAPLDPPPGSVIALHKPVGYVCSSADVPPLVYALLPSRFLLRRPVMAPVGRLDRDTSGLLLLTDDGPLNHRLTSPRHHLPRRYRATLAHALRGDEAAIFESGTMRLAGETKPLLPAALSVLDAHTVELTLREGRYHQVRRMFAAVGNHVEALHRTAIGELTLDDLAPAAWRVLSDADRALLRAP